MTRLTMIFSTLVVLGGLMPAPASVFGEESVVVRVGPREVSRAMLNDAVNQALNTGYFHRRMTEERRAELERSEISKLIRRELNYLGGLDRGMTLPEGQGEAARSAIEERLGREQYETVLKATRMTRKDHLRALSETLVAAEAYRRFVLEPALVGDDEVRTAFEANPGHWKMPESAHVFHILLNVVPGADGKTNGAVEGAAAGLMKRLRAGEDFGAVAAEASQDMYRIKGGDLGWLHRGRLLPAVDDAVWKAEVGVLVGPIRSPEGFHIIKVVGRRPARPMDLAEVEPMLRERLEKEKLNKAEAAWFGPLREKYPVVVLDPDLGEGID